MPPLRADAGSISMINCSKIIYSCIILYKPLSKAELDPISMNVYSLDQYRFNVVKDILCDV